ncbi:MAG: conjugal transfer protein TraG N-terminal domain-containing protein [Neisseriaceae bacterium]|nr:conjugal transfer protein TraG N-terminal domain-containing protein [Neisseriaceae bacterium]
MFFTTQKTHQQKTLKQLFFILKNSMLLLFLCLFPMLSFADDIFNQKVPPAADKNSVTNTIWIVGDNNSIASALEACAMIFHASAWRNAFIVATILLLGAMAINIVIKRNMQVFDYIVFLVISMCLFLPKTTVYVDSYYKADPDTGNMRGANEGANSAITIDNIPVGIAWPLAITSHISKSFTEMFDQGMQSVDKNNSYLIQGAEGYFSPLKSVLRLREAWDIPEISQNLENIAGKCQPRNVQNALNKGGVRAALDSQQEVGGGTVPFTFMGDEQQGTKPLTLQVECPLAMTLTYYQMLVQVTPQAGKGYSPIAERLAKSQSLSNATLGYSGKDITVRAKLVQNEMNGLPDKILEISGKGGSSTTTDPRSLLNATRQYLVQQLGQGDEYYAQQSTDIIYKRDVLGEIQQYLIADSINAAEIQANIVFSNLVGNCLGNGSGVCKRSNRLMTDAISRATIDSAGGAGMFQHFIHHSMNVLMFVYIIMSPIMIIVIVAMGIRGWKLMSAYLLLAVWINSWLPASVGITNYMLNGYETSLHNLVTALSASGANEKEILSPFVLSNILNGASDMIASASSMLSMVPMIMFALLSGSAYGLVQIAQRAGMTGKEYVDESKVVPELEEATGAAMMLQRNAQMSPTGYVSSAQLESGGLLTNAAMNDKKILSFQTTDEIGTAHSHLNQSTLSMADSDQTTRQIAHMTSDGIVTSDGCVYVKDHNGTHSWQQVHKGDDIKQFAAQNQAVAAIVESESVAASNLNRGADGGEYGAIEAGRDTLKMGFGLAGKKVGVFSFDTTESATTQSSESSSHSTSDTLSNANGVSFTVSDKFDENSSLIKNLTRTEQEQISKTFSQNLSHTNSDISAIQQAVSEKYSTSSTASFGATTLATDTNLGRDTATTQQIFSNSATAAEQYSSKVADEIRMAQHGSGYNDTGNAVQDVNRVLLKYADSDNMNEQLAAKAAISNIFNTQGVSVNANGDALGEVTAKELELTEKINEFKRTQDVAVFTRPVNAENVNRYEVGQFEKPLDYDKSKEEFDAKTSQTMVEKHADLLQHKGKIDTQRQAVVDSNKQAMSAMELKADTHVRGHERGIDKIERPWEVYNDAWGVPQEEVEAAKAERAARLGGIQHTNNSDNNQVGGLSHAVYTAPNGNEPQLMYDNGRPVEENTTPLAENQQQEVSGSLNTQSATVANEHKEQHPISDNAQPFQVPEYLRQPENHAQTETIGNKDATHQAKEIVDSAIMGALGIQTAHAGTMDLSYTPTPQTDALESWGDKVKDAVGNAAVKVGIAEPIYTATLDMPNQESENAQQNIMKTGYQGQGETPFSDNQNADTPYQPTQQTDRWAFVGNVGSAENTQSPQSNEPKSVADNEQSDTQKSEQEAEQRKAEEQARLAEQKAAEEKARLEREKAEEEQRKAEEERKKKEEEKAKNQNAHSNKFVSATAPKTMERHYVDKDGNVTIKQDGSRSWRNNNSGNIVYGKFAKAMGAIGTDGRFAIFPDEQTGDKARERLIFGGDKYRHLSLKDAIWRYAPPNENNTELYYKTIKNAVGVDKKMQDYSAEERQVILNAMKKHEGYKVGKVIKK